MSDADLVYSSVVTVQKVQRVRFKSSQTPTVSHIHTTQHNLQDLASLPTLS